MMCGDQSPLRGSSVVERAPSSAVRCGCLCPFGRMERTVRSAPRVRRNTVRRSLALAGCPWLGQGKKNKWDWQGGADSRALAPSADEQAQGPSKATGLPISRHTSPPSPFNLPALIKPVARHRRRFARSNEIPRRVYFFPSRGKEAANSILSYPAKLSILTPFPALPAHILAPRKT
jgi:hypothetical protein